MKRPLYISLSLLLLFNMFGDGWAQQHSSHQAKAYIEKLTATDGFVRAEAENKLLNIGSAAIPSLRDALLGKDDETALKSAAILGEIGPASVPALTQVLSDKRFYSNFSRTKAIVDALGRIGPIAVPSMVKVCIGEDGWRQPSTFLIMGVVKQLGPPAVPGLEEAARKGSPGSRYLSAILLGDIRDEASTSVLIRLLRDDETKVRTEAAVALQKLGEKAKDAIPSLIYLVEREHDLNLPKGSLELKDEPYINLRSKAIEALGQIAPNAEEVLRLLMKAVKDKQSDVRSQAVTVLGKMRERATTVVPILIEALRDESGNVRQAAATALGQIGAQAKVAVPHLLSNSADTDGRVRKEIIKALETIAPEAEETFVVVSKSKNDKYPAVRSQAVTVMGKMRARTITVVPILIEALKDENGNVRQAAATALGQIGPEAKLAASGLIELLRDGDGRVRKEAIAALGKVGPGAKDAIPALVKIMREKGGESGRDAAQALRAIGSASVPLLVEALQAREGDVRRNAAEALSGIQPKPQEAASALANMLKDEGPMVRKAAANALGQIGPGALVAVPALAQALKDANVEVRSSCASALGRIGHGPRNVVFALMETLGKDENPGVRSYAANALGLLGQGNKEVVSTLIRALNNDENSGVRSSAVNSLGRIGSGAKDAIPTLIEALNKKADLRRPAADSLVNIAKSSEDAKETGNIAQLKKAHRALAENPDLATERYSQYEHAKSVQRAIEHLELMWWKQYINSIMVWILQHPFYIAFIIVYILWVVICLLLLLCFPLMLLRVNDFFRPYEAKLLDWPFEIRLPLRLMLFVGPLNYHRRVLDAWVLQHIESTRRRFLEMNTVSQRAIHIPVPVELENNNIPVLEAKNLIPTFSNKIGFLLITGEGGSGKTSLACQIAKWAMAEEPNMRISDHLMLPVLIEHELEFSVAERKDKLTGAIGRQLQLVADVPKPIPEELLLHLLTSQRILVIIDHFSEMSQETRKVINPKSPSFAANALVVTSRLTEDLGGPTTVLKPLRIEGNRLSSFMEAYLVYKQKKKLFDDADFFKACGGLSAMVKEREITVLLAKLYADQVVAVKEGVHGTKLPQNVPDLMLSYLNEINRGVTEERLDDDAVHRFAKIVAWECLKQTYKPGPAKVADVFAAINEGTGESHLKYLEGRLYLIETVQPRQDTIRFLLDPLAEYLAGLYIVDTFQTDGTWKEFFKKSDSLPGAPAEIRGFLSAVLDCCQSKGHESAAFWVRELKNRIGLKDSSPLV